MTDLIQSALLALRVSVPSTLHPREAQPDTPSKLRLLGSPRHFDEYTIYGLRAACRKAGYELERGGETASGREEIRALFRRVSHGGPAIAVSPEATWTLRAFAGGYARDATSTLPIENAYAVLMEPLEAFAARLRLGESAVANPINWAYTKDGRRYVFPPSREPLMPDDYDDTIDFPIPPPRPPPHPRRPRRSFRTSSTTQPTSRRGGTSRSGMVQGRRSRSPAARRSPSLPPMHQGELRDMLHAATLHILALEARVTALEPKQGS